MSSTSATRSPSRLARYSADSVFKLVTDILVLTGGSNPKQTMVSVCVTALDREGFPAVRIVASGGFTAERIGRFESLGVPVDAYGVGSSLIRGQNDFTADVVVVDGRPCAKVGRGLKPNPRLELVG